MKLNLSDLSLQKVVKMNRLLDKNEVFHKST